MLGYHGRNENVAMWRFSCIQKQSVKMREIGEIKNSSIFLHRNPSSDFLKKVCIGLLIFRCNIYILWLMYGSLSGQIICRIYVIIYFVVKLCYRKLRDCAG